MSSDHTHTKHGDIFNERYHAFNKWILCATGLWPGQPFKQTGVRTIGLLIVSIVIMVAQVRAMIGVWGRFNLFIECITPLAMNILGVLKLISGLIHTQQMRKLFDQMQKDWDDMRHLPQINILKQRGVAGRRWTLFYFILIYIIVCLWVVMAFSPKIMDALAPLNCSRKRFDLFPTDFMVNPDDYFYPILIFVSLGLLYQVLVNVAIDTLYMILAQHACAMVDILRYKLHNVFQDEEFTNVILKPHHHKDMHYHEIIACIKKHKIITEYIKGIESTCEWKLFAIIGLNMLALTFTGYMVIATNDDGTMVDTLRYAFFGIGQVFHLFCNTLPGHWIMDSSSCVPTSAYSCRWYMMSLRSRNLIVFILRASIEPCKIRAGKMYVLSVKNFSRVLQTSISYLTMLNSMQ